MASEVEICNLALSRLGAEAIRSFDENNKRARLSEITYKHVRDLFLEDYEWTFNTKYAQLALLASESHPKFSYVYAVPSDCLYPRQLLDSSGSIDSRTQWEVFSTYIATDLSDPWLRYSEAIIVTGKFPLYFIEALSAQIAAELCPSIVQDKKRYEAMVTVAEARLARARDKDAEMGVEYLHRDNDPQFDRFVFPTGSVDDGSL